MKCFRMCCVLAIAGLACSSAPGQAPADGGGEALCSFAAASAPDFSLSSNDPANYDGPALVTPVEGRAALVLLPEESSGPVMSVDGALSTIPLGATLWTKLYWSRLLGNPLSFRFVSGWTLRGAKAGPVLAQQIEDLVPTGSVPLTFLDVPVTASPACSKREITNIRTGVSCMTTHHFSVTIHGDADLTLLPGREGQVFIGGVEYVVWLRSAYTETITATPCVEDWEPPVGFSIAGRAVRLTDVLDRSHQDGGTESALR